MTAPRPGWMESQPQPDLQCEFGPLLKALRRTKRGPRRNPAERFRWGEAEQRNERVFALLGGNEGYEASDDDKQEKALALLWRPGSHFRPQCGWFSGTWADAFPERPNYD